MGLFSFFPLLILVLFSLLISLPLTSSFALENFCCCCCRRGIKVVPAGRAQLPCWHRSLGDTSAAQRRSSARSCYCRRGRPKTGSASPPPTLRPSDGRAPAGTSTTSAATSSPSSKTSPSPKPSLPLRSSSPPTRCRCTMGGKTCFTVHLNPLWAKN